VTSDWWSKAGAPVKCIAVFSFLLVTAGLVGGQAFKPAAGFVPNSETAVKIAEAVLAPIYGKEKIELQKPFTAKLKNDVWTVQGTLHCPNSAEHCVGGVAVVEISKTDGRIIFMGHGK
jgi:NTF2 fold immunity protein